MDASFKLAVVLSAVNNTGAAFSAIQSQADKLQSRRDKFKDAAQDLFSIGSAASVGIASAFVKKGMDLQDTKTRFEVFLRDGAKAKQMLEELNKFADITPFSNDQVYNAATSLLPYIKDTEKMKHHLSMLGDVASGLKIPFNELASTYGKMISQDVIQMDDLNKLIERGFDVNIIAKAMHTSKEAIRDLSHDGKIHFKDIKKAFELATKEGGDFYQMTEIMSKTTSGKLSTAMGQFNYQISSIAEQSLPIITAGLDNVIPLLEKFGGFIENNQELVGTFAQIAIGMTATNVAFKTGRFMYQGMALFFTKISGAVVGISNFTNAIKVLKAAQSAGDMAAWYRALENYGTAGNWAARSLGMTAASQTGLNTAIYLNPYVIAVTGLVALGAALYYANKKMTELTDSEKAELDIKGKAINLIDKEHGEFTKLWMAMEETEAGSKRRSMIIKQLNESYPNYIRHMELEKADINDLKNYYNRATESMIEYATQKEIVNAIQGDIEGIAKANREVYLAQRTKELTGGNIGDKLSNDGKYSSRNGVGALAYLFSQQKSIDDALKSKKESEISLEANRQYKSLIDKKLAEKENPSVVNNIKVIVGGKEVSARVEEQQRVENRGSIKK